MPLVPDDIPLGIIIHLASTHDQLLAIVRH